MKRLSDFVVGFLLWAIASACLLMGAAHDARGQVPIYTRGGGTATSVGPAAFPLLAPDGTGTAPSYAFANNADLGLWRVSNGILGIAQGTQTALIFSRFYMAQAAQGELRWSNTSSDPTATADLVLTRDAAGTFAQKNGANAQVRRLYFSTTGPVYFMESARTAGVLFTGTGGAMQLSTAQTTVPTCTANCGTSPSIVGTDTAMRVTMGASGVPASAWVVTFNGTWPSAPVCHVTAALATMVVGKQAIAVVTTTTTITVTTNGTAPATSDQYQIICMGVS